MQNKTVEKYNVHKQENENTHNKNLSQINSHTSNVKKKYKDHKMENTLLKSLEKLTTSIEHQTRILMQKSKEIESNNQEQEKLHSILEEQAQTDYKEELKRINDAILAINPNKIAMCNSVNNSAINSETLVSTKAPTPSTNIPATSDNRISNTSLEYFIPALYLRKRDPAADEVRVILRNAVKAIELHLRFKEIERYDEMHAKFYELLTQNNRSAVTKEQFINIVNEINRWNEERAVSMAKEIEEISESISIDKTNSNHINFISSASPKHRQEQEESNSKEGNGECKIFEAASDTGTNDHIIIATATTTTTNDNNIDLSEETPNKFVERTHSQSRSFLHSLSPSLKQQKKQKRSVHTNHHNSNGDGSDSSSSSNNNSSNNENNNNNNSNSKHNDNTSQEKLQNEFMISTESTSPANKLSRYITKQMTQLPSMNIFLSSSSSLPTSSSSSSSSLSTSNSKANNDNNNDENKQNKLEMETVDNPEITTFSTNHILDIKEKVKENIITSGEEVKSSDGEGWGSTLRDVLYESTVSAPSINLEMFLNAPRSLLDNTTVNVSTLYQIFAKEVSLMKCEAELVMWDTNNDGRLSEDEVESYVRDLVPRIAALQRLSDELLPFYCCTVSRRLFWDLDLSNRGMIRIEALLQSAIMEEWVQLQLMTEDSPTSWFGSIVTQHLYEKFLLLDTRNEGTLNVINLRRYKKGLPTVIDDGLPINVSPLSSLFIDRFFETNVVMANGELDYRKFVDFVIAVEKLPQCSRPLFFWNILDLHQTNVLTPLTVNYFFRETHAKLVSAGLVVPPREVVMQEVFDLIPSAQPLLITRNEFLASPQAGLFASLIIDCLSFWTYENREQR